MCLSAAGSADNNKPLVRRLLCISHGGNFDVLSLGGGGLVCLEGIAGHYIGQATAFYPCPVLSLRNAATFLDLDTEQTSGNFLNYLPCIMAKLAMIFRRLNI